MNRSLFPVILAGGKGERFWPLSTPEKPKPFLNFFSERSLLQQTFERAISVAPAENVYLMIGESHAKLVREQLPALGEQNLILEPTGRDTSAAIGYASLHLPSDALMLVLPADHLIPDLDEFEKTVLAAAEFAFEHGGPLTFGVVPTRPETNYGYILSGKKFDEAPTVPVYKVLRFVEKPDLEKAKQYVADSSYYWNSGIFLWRVSRIQQLIAQYLPDLWENLQEIFANPDTSRHLYSSLPRISIDFGVMEKAPNVAVVPAGFRWDDIGTWNSLLRFLEPNADGNLVWGQHTGLDTSGCIIYSDDHQIATAGLRNLVIVQRGNQTLICTRESADRIKDLLAMIPS